jgi:hypothetical protein
MRIKAVKGEIVRVLMNGRTRGTYVTLTEDINITDGDLMVIKGTKCRKDGTPIKHNNVYSDKIRERHAEVTTFGFVADMNRGGR